MSIGAPAFTGPRKAFPTCVFGIGPAVAGLLTARGAPVARLGPFLGSGTRVDRGSRRHR